jgi:hypothetical protein
MRKALRKWERSFDCAQDDNLGMLSFVCESTSIGIFVASLRRHRDEIAHGLLFRNREDASILPFKPERAGRSAIEI